MKIPAYTLHKPTGQARCRLDGKDHYLGAYGTPESKRRYEVLIAEWLARKSGATAPVPEPTIAGFPRLTVADLLARYWEHAQQHYRKGGTPTRQLAKIKPALAVVRERFGTVPAGSFGPRALKESLAEFAAKGWTRGFCNSALGIVKRAFKWAVSEELIPPAVWQGLAAVPGLRRGVAGCVESEPVRPVPWEWVERTLPELLPEVADMVRLQHLAGMRPCEVCGLRVRDIDREGRVPDGPTLPGVWVYVVADDVNKTAHHGRRRIVFLGPKTQAILAPHLAGLEPDDHVFSPRRVVSRWLARVGRRNRKRKSRAPGERYSTSSYDHAIAAAAKRAGVPRWGPNKLRHARATELRAVADLGVAGAVLGHSSLETTTIYAEQALTAAAEVMKRVG